jgi:signal transduction histidine kinase/CheY-like chemotaxis protein
VYGPDRAEALTVRDGLLSNRVTCFLEDSRGGVWLGTEHLGISSLQDGRWVHYSHTDGLPSHGLVALGEYPEGCLWAAFDKNRIYRYLPFSGDPDTSIAAAPDELAPDSPALLSFTGYDAWNDTSQDDLEFSWRLVSESSSSLSTEWSSYTPNPSLKTDPLEPGSYRLEVRSQDRDRNEDPTPASFEFVVLRPVWRRPEVITPMALLLALAGVLAWHLLRNHRLLKENRDRLHGLVKERTLELASTSAELETEKRQLEEEQIKNQKLESVGVLAGGIAHDFNNLLTAIVGNVTLAKRVTDSKSDAKVLLGDAEKACWRARDLTVQLLTFSKGGAPIRKSTRIEEIITDSASFSLHGSNVHCEMDVPTDLWTVDVDGAQISQVIQNIVINAVQAMPEGGRIRIEARNAGHVKSADPRLVDLGDGLYVRVTIGDEGEGISPATLEKIFDPYFTTKRKGSGLGLAIAYSIVRRHGGTITVDSTLDKGSEFSLYLPVAQEPSVPVDAARNGDSIVLGKKSILLMDDEPSILTLLTVLLESRGHSVCQARSGDEAVDLFRTARLSDTPIDLVILDLTIPGETGGRETMSRLMKIEPDVKGIVSSGYSGDPVMANYRDYGFRAVISKPYSLDELNELVNRILSEDE